MVIRSPCLSVPIRRSGRALQLHPIALRVPDVDRWSVAVGAIARLDLARDSMRLQMRENLVAVPRLDAKRDMVDVAAVLARRRAAHLPERPIDRHQVDEDRAEAQLVKADVVPPPLPP